MFSFGVILMELVTGKTAVGRGAELENIHLLDWVMPQYERGDMSSIVDKRLSGNFRVDAAWTIVEMAISCLHESPARRPEISNVLAELKQCLATERLSSLGNRSGRSSQDGLAVVESGEMTRPIAR